MSEDILGDRRRALEEEFFAKQNQQLLRQLQETKAATAEQSGLSKDSASYQLLEEWFREQPPPKLLAAWKAYVVGLSQTLDVQAKQALKQDLLGRAHMV